MSMVSGTEEKAVVDFLYTEARLADESRYDEWEALWEDDALYWIPANAGGDTDPARELSHLYDNRARIATRIRMLKTGYRYSQTPPSPLRRVISNIEVEKTTQGEFVAASNFLLLEMSVQATPHLVLWGGRIMHKLRLVDGELKMFFKKVLLVNAGEPLPNLTFLI
jgi:3-phenylpropionate/cinnamic acid dioxygenase small subunit